MAEDRTPTQVETAYDQLRRLLSLQKLAAGRRLSEPYWCRRLHVNRSAIREAMARLEGEGWLKSLPRCGYAVPQFTDEDIEECWEIRVALESAAVRRICRLRRNSASDLKTLRSACEHLESLVAQDYHLAILEADWRFHEHLVELGATRMLLAFNTRARIPGLRAGMETPDGCVANGSVMLQWHRRIVAALEEGDAAAAEAALREELSQRSAAP